MKWFIGTILTICFCIPALGADPDYTPIKNIPLQSEFKTRSDWHVVAYQSAEEDIEFSEVPARICFEASDEKPMCTRITSALPNDEMRYAYQHVKELSVMARPHLIKFMAEFGAAGSGWLDQVSFWQYEKETDSFQQAGLITLTEQGEYQLFEDKGLLVTADGRWGDGETHFSPHYFDITVYRYKANDGYEKLFSYLTAQKYPSFDDVEKIDVISHEKNSIAKRLAN